jgi:hypothetical protein
LTAYNAYDTIGIDWYFNQQLNPHGVIMRPIRYDSHRLLQRFRRETVLTMAMIEQELGTSGKATVFRKLKELAWIPTVERLSTVGIQACPSKSRF